MKHRQKHYTMIFLALWFQISLFIQIGISQNYVKNYSFEDTLSCAQWGSILWPYLPTIGWYQSIGTPDMFSSTFTPWCGSVPLPNSPLGYQFPRTGNNCSGFATSAMPFVADAKEFITGGLTSGLIQNHTYYVEFYANAGDNCRLRVDKIGAYFSIDSINPDTFNFPYQMIPQVENPAGNVLNDTAGWEKISGYFVAQGGEKWITLGCFHPDSELVFDSILNWVNPEAYYLIDDISVIDCTASSINEVAALAFQLLNNAATHTLTVTSEGISAYSIIAMDGKTILSKYTNEPQPKIEIDIGSLARGMYVLQVIDKPKRIGYKKFVRL